MERIRTDPHYPFVLDDIPPTWATVFVGEVIKDIRNGFSSGTHNKEGIGIVHLRPMNINRLGQIELSDVKYVLTDSDLRVTAGDVLFNNTNSVELVGKTAPIIEKKTDWAFSNHMTRLRPPRGISHRFLAYQLHFLWMKGYFRYRSTQHVNQASISSGTLSRTVPLILPPEAEQLRIVAEIEKQFDRLEVATTVLTRSIGSLEDYRNATLQQACEGKLVPTESELALAEGRDYESGQHLLEGLLKEKRSRWETEQLAKMKSAGRLPKKDTWKAKYKEPEPPDVNALPMLPGGWVWARVDQVGEITLGRQRAPKYQSGRHMRPYLRVANVFENRIDTTDVLQMNFTPEEYEVYRLEVGDILLNEGQSIDLVGRPAMYRGEVPGACFQKTLLRFRAYPGVSPSFALIVFRHYLRSKHFQKIAKWSTNIAHLSAVRFTALEFPLPPLAEQERIASEVERRLNIADSQGDVIASSLKNIEELRETILERAFSGKLVAQDANDQPVEELLRVIKEQITEPDTGRLIKARGKPVRSEKMTKRKRLYEVLKQAKTKLRPEDLLEKSGIEEDLVDDFFEELKQEVLRGRITEVRSPNGRDVYLSLKAGRA